MGTLAHYDPLRGKQQGLGTKLPHAKTSGLPGCAWLAYQSAWRVRGTKRWAAGGGVRRSGPHELRWGGAVARALRNHPGGGAQIMRF